MILPLKKWTNFWRFLALVLSMVHNHQIYTFRNSCYFFFNWKYKYIFFIQIPVLIGLIFFLHSYCEKKFTIWIRNSKLIRESFKLKTCVYWRYWRFPTSGFPQRRLPKFVCAKFRFLHLLCGSSASICSCQSLTVVIMRIGHNLYYFLLIYHTFLVINL